MNGTNCRHNKEKRLRWFGCVVKRDDLEAMSCYEN